jgi:hypothetical protein
MDRTYIHTRTRNAFNIVVGKPHWGPGHGQEKNVMDG